MKYKITKCNFLDYANLVHNKYSYCIDSYIDPYTKLEITCRLHGVFYQTPYKHINEKQGCKECGRLSLRLKQSKSIDIFLVQAFNVHGYFYDYSNVVYKNAHTKIDIICKEHGIYKQTPNAHINGSGCKKCAGEKLNDKFSNKKTFKNNAVKVHGLKYNYDKSSYINCDTKIDILCNMCNEYFKQTPYKHINEKQGCPNHTIVFGNYTKYCEKFENTILYFVEFTNEFETFYKIGITSRSVFERYNMKMYNGYDINILFEINDLSSKLCIEENKILKKFKKYKYSPLNKIDGYSECFNNRDKIIEYLKIL